MAKLDIKRDFFPLTGSSLFFTDLSPRSFFIYTIHVPSMVLLGYNNEKREGENNVLCLKELFIRSYQKFFIIIFLDKKLPKCNKTPPSTLKL